MEFMSTIDYTGDLPVYLMTPRSTLLFGVTAICWRQSASLIDQSVTIWSHNG